jgi:hypothetical protein
MLTTVDFSGRVLGTAPSVVPYPLGTTAPHPDGRSFYIFDWPSVVLRLDAETLAVLERYDLSAFRGPAPIGVYGVGGIQGTRVLLGGREGNRSDLFDPRILFTVDLNTRTATPQIHTGLGASDVRLLPSGQTILLQEPRTATSIAGAGRLHFFDAATGNKLGALSFRADRGGTILGLHPDGRRLFIRTWNADPATGDRLPHLVIVDVVARTVVRDRPFPDIGFAVDFVDEP